MIHATFVPLWYTNSIQKIGKINEASSSNRQKIPILDSFGPFKMIVLINPTNTVELGLHTESNIYPLKKMTNNVSKSQSVLDVISISNHQQLAFFKLHTTYNMLVDL